MLSMSETEASTDLALQTRVVNECTKDEEMIGQCREVVVVVAVSS